MAAQASAKKADSTSPTRPLPSRQKPVPRAVKDELHGDRSNREAQCPTEAEVDAAWLRSDVWPTAKNVPARAGADDEVSSVRPRPTPPGQRVLAERYVLLRPLVSGETDLWLADHRARGRTVVIRLCARGQLADAAARERFRRQAAAAERVRCAHLVELYDHGVDASSPFSVMELLEGEDLARRLRRLGKLSAIKTTEVVTQVARALARVHASKGLVGDLRASKVFFEAGRNTDIETLKLLPAADIHAEVRFGLAPDLRAGKVSDHRADLWSLGALAWHCLTGRELSSGEIPPPASQIAPELAAFDAWFARALAADPSERFSCARAMSDAFAEVATHADLSGRDRYLTGRRR